MTSRRSQGLLRVFLDGLAEAEVDEVAAERRQGQSHGELLGVGSRPPGAVAGQPGERCRGERGPSAQRRHTGGEAGAGARSDPGAARCA